MKPGTKHLCVKCIQVCTNQGPFLSQKGDNDSLIILLGTVIALLKLVYTISCE